MSEVDRHHGQDPVGRDRTPRPGAEKTETSPIDRATQALKDAAAAAAREAERVKDGVTTNAERAADWASDGYETVSRNANYARRRSEAEINRGRRGLEYLIEENPIMVGVAGLAAGLLIGALLPGTRRENQVVGRYADDAKREGLRYVHDIAEQGKALLHGASAVSSIAASRSAIHAESSEKRTGAGASAMPNDKHLHENSQENLDKRLDNAAEESFPGSDPVSVKITK